MRNPTTDSNEPSVSVSGSKETVHFKLQTLPISVRLVVDGSSKRLAIMFSDDDTYHDDTTKTIVLSFASDVMTSSTVLAELLSLRNILISPVGLSQDECTRI